MKKQPDMPEFVRTFLRELEDEQPEERMCILASIATLFVNEATDAGMPEDYVIRNLLGAVQHVRDVRSAGTEIPTAVPKR